MENLKDFEEDIYKCSRCGLCQFVCPVYKACLNECAVSKGKFNMLNGIIKGDLILNRQIKKYMDLCTGCNACKDFCPSGIDARKIFITVKNEYYQNCQPSLTERILNSYFLFKTALLFAKPVFVLYRLLKVDRLIEYFSGLFLKLGEIGKRLLLLNSLAKSNESKQIEITQHKKTKTKKAIYFEGCFNKYLNPQTENAVLRILENSDIELIKKDFECCGVSYLADGNIKDFKKLVETNLSKVDEDFDWFVTDCASCKSVLKEYKNFSDSESALAINEKAVSITELIKGLNFESLDALKVSVHIPCHEDFDFVALIQNIKNITYVEADNYNKCCGFSGTFALKNPEISKEISREKAQNYVNAEVDIILTTCPACVLGLEQGLLELQNIDRKKPKVMNLFVFLEKYCVSI